MRLARLVAMLGMIVLVSGCPVTPPAEDGAGNGDAVDGGGNGDATGGDTTGDTGGTTDPGDATAGKTVFDTNCMVCHAADASGDIGPNIQGEPADDIEEHAVNGHEGHTLFELSATDVADIEAYLATLVP